jgi:hypothetical protein
MATRRKKRNLAKKQNPSGIRARWWNFTSRLDLAARLARWMEPRFQRWWVPAILLSFPVLMLILALIIMSLR